MEERVQYWIEHILVLISLMSSKELIKFLLLVLFVLFLLCLLLFLHDLLDLQLIESLFLWS